MVPDMKPQLPSSMSELQKGQIRFQALASPHPQRDVGVDVQWCALTRELPATVRPGRGEIQSPIERALR